VLRINSRQILIVISDINKLEICQMDVETSFLNDELNKKVYMKQFKGLIVKLHEMKVCKLIKSLYGLK
jgi:hypothetical protein